MRGHPMVVVPAIVNGLRQVHLLVDTGAYRTLISSYVARVLDMDLDRP